MELDKKALDAYIEGRNDPHAPFNQPDIDPEQCVEDLISVFDNHTREGLTETPKRYVKFLEEFLNPASFTFTTFSNEEGNDEMIAVCHIPFYSLCEHHLAPFFGVGHIAYIPTDKIVGLSKIPRVLDMFARRFQNQERIGVQVANYLVENLSPDVAVILSARHMCMEMRGVEKPGTMTTTAVMRGKFKSQSITKNEFLNYIKIQNHG
jgi:GTP cyclohydrolase I